MTTKAEHISPLGSNKFNGVKMNEPSNKLEKLLKKPKLVHIAMIESEENKWNSETVN